MFFKKEIVIAVYNLYIESVPLQLIAYHYDLSDSDVDYIINYVNQIIV